MKNNPDKKLYVATKIPPKNGRWPARSEYSLEDCYPPEYIEESIHKSLGKLGLESMDLIQFHTWDDSWVRDDRWYRKLSELRSQGLIQAVGISLNRWEPWNGVEAVRSSMVDAVQVVYNVFDQNPEDELFPACREMDAAVIVRVPFDEGSLTGTLTSETTWPEDDWRNRYFSPENLKATVARVDALKQVLRPGVTLPELALRFILADPAVSTIIPGMRRPAHVKVNLATSDAGPLPDELMAELRKHRWVRLQKPQA